MLKIITFPIRVLGGSCTKRKGYDQEKRPKSDVGVLRKKFVLLLLLALLIAQPAEATTYPITFAFGRSWPLYLTVDSARGLAYADGTSGINPMTGFSFGVINVTTHQLAKVLPLDEIPGPVALDGLDGDVFVAGNYTIEVYDAATQNFSGFLRVGLPIQNVAFDGNASNDIFVTAGDGVYAMDPQTDAIVANATVRGGPDGMALDPANGRLFVAEYLSPVVAVFQASNLHLVGTVSFTNCCATSPQSLALDPITQTLYASTGTGYVEMINAENDSLIRSVLVAPSAGNSTNAIAVDVVNDRVYVASSPGGSVLELDGSTGAVIRTLEVPSDSQVVGLAVDTSTQEVYAPNYHEITVFDAARTGIIVGLVVFGGVGVALVAAVAVALYLFLRKKEARELTRIQSG